MDYWQGQRSLQPQLKTLTDQVASLRHPPVNTLAAANTMRSPMPFRPSANVPPNATPEMKEFMQNRATLMQKMAELRQQNPSTNGAPDPKIFAEFQQENADLLKRQKELSQIIAQQQAKNPIPAPPPWQMPPNASPQLQAYGTDGLLSSRTTPWKSESVVSRDREACENRRWGLSRQAIPPEKISHDRAPAGLPVLH